jgi:hypothetical protein
MPRLFLNRSVQIRPKAGRDFVKVNLSQALKVMWGSGQLQHSSYIIL